MKASPFHYSAFIAISILCTVSHRIIGQGVITLKVGIGKSDSPALIFTTKEPSDKALALVNNLFAFTGSVQKINIKESNDIDYARVGLDDRNVETILINPVDMEKNDNCSKIAILSHEVGHIVNGHLFKEITPELELAADYYSGFLSRRLKFGECSERLSNITEAFKLFGEGDGVHSAFDVRIEQVERGWEKADERFTFPGSKIDIINSVDLFLGVSANKNEERPDLHYKVIMSIKPSLEDLSQETVYSSIKKVKYTLHYTMRRNAILRYLHIPSFKIIKDKYKKKDFYHIIQVWGSFPIKAKVYFKGGKKRVFTENYDDDVKITKKSR